MSKATRSKKPKLKAKKPVKRTAKRAAAPPEKEITRGRGRPSEYTHELAFEICALIAEGGTLNEVAAKTCVDRRTILRWIDKHDDFCHRYARARELQGDAYADEIKHLMRRVVDPKMPDDLKLDANAARVAIDARKLSAGQRAPRPDRAKLMQENTRKDRGPGDMKEKTDTLDTARWVADILLTGKAEAEKRKRADDEDGDKRVH